MPKPRSAKLESATARRKLPIRKKPYWTTISPNIALGYRRNEGAGTWSVRRTGEGAAWIKRIALADDLERSNGREVLSYWEALDAARKVARAQPGDDADDGRPMLVSEALDCYKANLEQQGGDPYNAERARLHLPAALLSKPVSLLSAKELERWLTGLSAKGLARSTINRVRTCVRAALTLAAKKERIADRSAWQDLDSLPDATEANNVVLDAAAVTRAVSAAYHRDEPFGLLVEVLAQTGARPSQAVRCEVADLDVADATAPKLKMPRSAKGGPRSRTRKRQERVAVPITTTLAAKLARAAAGRSADAPLLLRGDGVPWSASRRGMYGREHIGPVLAAAKLPPGATLYALRHTAITRSLLAGVPVSVVAANADTSEREIRRHYRRYISTHADEIARRGLPQIELPTAA